jgi:hypothetical protein
MYELIVAKTMNAVGAADATELKVMETHNFVRARNVLVQTVVSNVFFNPTQGSPYKLMLTVSEYVQNINGKKVTKTFPPFTIANNLEITNCVSVTVTLTYQNGGGTGIMNIYAIR